MTLEQAIASLQELNEAVPEPARLPLEVEVSAMEEELRVKFHPDFRAYLLKASDVTVGTLEPVTITDPQAHTHLPTIAGEAWEELDLPRNLLPICEDNGDYYCIDNKGKIVFWSGDGTSGESWPNLAAWIEQVWIGENTESEDDDE